MRFMPKEGRLLDSSGMAVASLTSSSLKDKRLLDHRRYRLKGMFLRNPVSSPDRLHESSRLRRFLTSSKCFALRPLAPKRQDLTGSNSTEPMGISWINFY